jgi:hypothetical protein
VRTLDEKIPVESKELIEKWKDVDKLRGKKWVAEVLRRRRILANRVAYSKNIEASVKKMVDRDKLALELFDEQLQSRMSRRRPLLLRRFHSVIKTPDGEIRIFNKKKVLDMEGADNDEVVAALESLPSTRVAVRIKKEPDKEALKQLSSRQLRRLASKKVWVGQMLYVSIKSAGERAAKNLVRERRKK